MTRMAASKDVDNAQKGGFRQAMSWLHTWAGLTLGSILYFMFVTGTAGYFDTEIDRWMQPELPPAQLHLDAANTASVLLERLGIEAPKAERWFLALPAGRQQPYPGIFWRGASVEAGASSVAGNLTLDLTTGKPFDARDTGGGQVLYRMHWLLHYLPRSIVDTLIGFATLFMLVALITGIIIHKKIFKDFFTFRPGKGQRSWLDAHNVLGVVALPFHLMMTYSGLIFMGFSYMPLVIAAHYGTNGEARKQFSADVFDPPGLVEATGKTAPLVPLEGLITTAEERWGEDRIYGIDIRHPGDSNARIIFYENVERHVVSNSERLVFDGVSGRLLHTVPAATSAAKNTRDLFIGLHEGLFAPPVLRWLYFLSGLLGAGMVATGLVLWAVKRRQRQEKKHSTPHFGLCLVEKINVGTVVGLPIGIAAYFWANRLLPVEMAGRADWEVHIMFLTWLAMLGHAVLRPTMRAWHEQLTIAGLAFGLLPLLNLITTDRHLSHSLVAGDWALAGFDLTVLAIGLALAWVAWYIYQKQLTGSKTLGSKTLANLKPNIESECSLYGERL